MPANRSRTQEWRRCLKQVYDRHGALEIAVAPSGTSNGRNSGPQLIWRVRILNLTDDEIVVEQPVALGQSINIEPGIDLVVVLCIGQNRWMFTTSHIGLISPPRGQDDRRAAGMRLRMPTTVQRCQRRNYYRIDTASVNLPHVDVWPLLDPKSVVVPERACVIQAEAQQGMSPDQGAASAKLDPELVLPEVGPRFTATLVNLGGGGVGLRVRPEDTATLQRHKLFWLRIMLPPALATPICATAKLAHTHLESNHETYAGLAFDFSFNPAHHRFVVDQICRYIALQQRAQLDQRPEPNRQVA